MAVTFGSILHLGNSGSEATLDANNLRGTTLLIDDFNSASLAKIGSGLKTAPGKRRLGTIVSTTGSYGYYVYSQTSSGDPNLSGSEWTNTSNWEKLALSSQISGAFINVPSTTIGTVTINDNLTINNDLIFSGSSGETFNLKPLHPDSGSLNISASQVHISGNLDLEGTFVFGGFSFEDAQIVVHSGSNFFGTQSTDIHSFTGSINVTGSGIFPFASEESSLGSSTKKWNDLYAVNTFFGGIHEVNLETKGLHYIQEGTVLSLKNGELCPCEVEADPLVIAITSKKGDYPIVMGAEPVLVTGKVKTGDYIITSKIKGHGKAVDPKYIYDKKLFGKIIAQSLEDGDGLSYLIKAMIRKM